ncbi:hypothetical protein F9278_01895 [Streptomyces phaeolivaceus]|uniref:Uncharacterized protein n=1 Tax=Streptomyces phaeolivaceus TaxID=2653200 RepID=A0A5P8JXM5_9ACTN|nr:DUF6153 family protein [Streptomyces phaeolivaceus]QFQ95149.1 hypothetical protein F9278_01895 [Streptomyces phaeolivaceus]
MSGRPFRRTAPPCARGRSARLMLVVSLVLTTFVLFCAGAPPGEAPAPRPHSVSADLPAERPDSARAGAVERDPCEHSPGGHDCHAADPAAVLGQAPLPGADHTAASWQPASAPAPVASFGSGEPGRARPPDLHELQLLRV